MKRRNTLIISTFLCFIFLIGILNVFTPIKLFSTTEKRKLAQKPNLNVGSVLDGSYTSDYEKYFNDQFIARDRWINLNTLSEVFIGKKEINNIYLGKNNYLIENNSIYNEDNLNNNLDIIKKMILYYSNSVGKDNIKVMIVPNAGAIHRDKLPLFASTMDQKSILEKAEEDFKGSLINVYPILKAHCNKYVYYKTDHHWTTLGAYYAYTKWAEDTGHSVKKLDSYSKDIVSRNFLGTLYSKINYSKEKDSITLFNKDNKYKVSYDLQEGEYTTLYELSHLETSDQYSTFLNGNHGLVEIETENRNGKSLLIFKDSYANSFIPFIVDDYEKVYVIDLRYYNGGIKSFIDDMDISELLLLFNLNNLAGNRTLYKILKKT